MEVFLLALNQTFDLNRIKNLETGNTTINQKLTDHDNALAAKLEKFVGGDVAGQIKANAANNGLIQVQPLTQTVWNGIMTDVNNYSYALGRFAANSNKIEFRAYVDDFTIRTGRKVGATSANLIFITNDQVNAGIQQDIKFLSRGAVKICPNNGGLDTNGINAFLNAAGMPVLQSINTGISNTSLKFASTQLQARDAADANYIAIGASGFAVQSERRAKNSIELCSDSVLEKVKDTPVRKYHLNTDEPNQDKRIGLVLDEVPAELVHDEHTLDLYSMTTMLWKAVQELTAKVEELTT